MNDKTFETKEYEKRMDGAIEVLARELGGLRSGRASTALLAPLSVRAYGDTSQPIDQLASLNVVDARTLSINVWDASVVAAVEKAIVESDLGLTPQTEGSVIRLHLPSPSAERRQDLAKIAARYAEEARIAVRNVRRDAIDSIRKQEKEKQVSQDEAQNFSELVQKITDRYVGKIDEALRTKEQEIATP